MMQANELRIGNLVNYPRSEGNDLCEIWSINFEQTVEISCDGNNEEESNYSMTVDCDKIKPIPLTEEWLIKLQFKKSQEGTFIVYDQYLIDIYSMTRNKGLPEFWNLCINSPKVAFVINIEFVNQLQNLYFALTGEELTIKQ